MSENRAKGAQAATEAYYQGEFSAVGEIIAILRCMIERESECLLELYLDKAKARAYAVTGQIEAAVGILSRNRAHYHRLLAIMLRHEFDITPFQQGLQLLDELIEDYLLLERMMQP